MLTLLPKIALFLCFLVFVVVLLKVFFFTRKEDVEHMSNLPLEEDDK